MEKYQPPAAAPAEGEADDAEPAEGAEDGEDANATLYVETSEALKDIVDAALQVSGLQVCAHPSAAGTHMCILMFRLYPQLA